MRPLFSSCATVSSALEVCGLYFIVMPRLHRIRSFLCDVVYCIQQSLTVQLFAIVVTIPIMVAQLSAFVVMDFSLLL